MRTYTLRRDIGIEFVNWMEDRHIDHAYRSINGHSLEVVIYDSYTNIYGKVPALTCMALFESERVANLLRIAKFVKMHPMFA